MCDLIREFLVDIANNEIIPGKKYSHRIEIEDGGFNSYISLCVDTEDYRRKSPVTSRLRLFRHSNSVNKLVNTWGFSLGDICQAYADNPDIPLEFSSYGKTKDEATTEAQGYFNELRLLIKKQTSDYKIEAAKSAGEEREKLLARLAELEEADDKETK